MAELADVSSAAATGRDERPESADVSSAAATGREDGKIGDLEETAPLDKLLATTQHWCGHWMMGSHQRVMTTELFFAANNKIYGGGNDKVGDFTWTGELRGTQVHLIEQQLVKDLSVEYEGEMKNSTIEGTWTIVKGHSAGTDAGIGTFLLMQESHKPDAKRSTSGDLPIVREPHHWKGYYRQWGVEYEMSTELLFTDNLKVYGRGTDSIGCYTWLGGFYQDGHGSTLVDMTKKYDAQHRVRYKGAIAQQQNAKLVIEGSWTIGRFGEGFQLEME